MSLLSWLENRIFEVGPSIGIDAVILLSDRLIILISESSSTTIRVSLLEITTFTGTLSNYIVFVVSLNITFRKITAPPSALSPLVKDPAIKSTVPFCIVVMLLMSVTSSIGYFLIFCYSSFWAER